MKKYLPLIAIAGILLLIASKTKSKPPVIVTDPGEPFPYDSLNRRPSLRIRNQNYSGNA